MVEGLEARVPHHAQRAGVGRVIRVSLELDDAAVAVLGDDAAAGRALAAHGCRVGGNARDDVVGRDDVRDELLGRLSAAPGGRCGAQWWPRS